MWQTLDKKLFRDLIRLWPQGLAIAAVMACGISTLILALGAYRSLEETRSVFYDHYRFANVFVSLDSAPKSITSTLSALPGVAALESRQKHFVLLDIPDMLEPATGLVVSIPDRGEPHINNLYIREGRLPNLNRYNEIAVLDSFASAHDFHAGDSIIAIMNGKKRHLTITGLVLSPEFIYAMGPGDMVPDNKRFGVFYMRESLLAGIYNKQGLFNDLLVRTLPKADTDSLIDSLDQSLKRYSGGGAYKRDGQISHLFLDSEMQQLKAMAEVLPPLFMLVSAYLVNMILTRLIVLEREQIGLLKAVGYSNWSTAWHYIKLVLVICIVGLVIGAVFGNWLGHALTVMYGEFFSFPFLVFVGGTDLLAIAFLFSLAAALAGASKSVYGVVALPPAVAMRPPSPPVYKKSILSAVVPKRILSPLTVMALRHLTRWPLRTFLTVSGISFPVALLVTGLFSYDSIDEMIDTIYFRTARQDATIGFTVEKGPSVAPALKQLPGVLKVELSKSTPVVLRSKQLEKKTALMATADEAELFRVLDEDMQAMQIPGNGLILSKALARALKVQPGDILELELTDKNHRIEYRPVTGVSNSYTGLSAHINLLSMHRLLRDGEKYSGAYLQIDQGQLPELYAEIKQTPIISAIALQDVSRQKFRGTIQQNITSMMSVYILLSVVITFGVVYNFARIQFSERARELASLRVFGFGVDEVSYVLLYELCLLVLLAQPAGWLMGYWFAWSVVQGFDSELFSIPLRVDLSTFALASLVVMLASLASALLVHRRIRHLNMIKVLKTRE